MKTIAIDFDDTYTANPKMFNKIIDIFKENDYKVCICTSRDPKKSMDVEKSNVRSIVDYIFFTDGEPKKEFMESLGIKIDIWIDDFPKSIIDRCYDNFTPNPNIK
jgi:hypothetical protein